MARWHSLRDDDHVQGQRPRTAPDVLGSQNNRVRITKAASPPVAQLLELWTARAACAEPMEPIGAGENSVNDL
jgi:hypothetical protein